MRPRGRGDLDQSGFHGLLHLVRSTYVLHQGPGVALQFADCAALQPGVVKLISLHWTRKPNGPALRLATVSRRLDIAVLMKHSKCVQEYRAFCCTFRSSM